MSGSSNSFASGSNQNAGNIITDRSTTRILCSPGGNSTISLGGEADPSTRGQKVTSNSFASFANPNSGNVLSERPSTSVRCAPGGASSIGDLLGGEAPAVDDRMTGKLTSSNGFASSTNPNAGNVLTDRSSTRIRCSPGGNSTMVLGQEDSFDRFANQNAQVVGSPTPDAQVRFPCAPGGNSSVTLGGDLPQALSTPQRTRVAAGGASTFVFGADSSKDPAPTPRTSPGGESTVVLGGDASGNRFDHLHTPQEQRASLKLLADVPAMPRFPCAPGGDTTISLRGDVQLAPPSATDRMAPGGSATIILGGPLTPSEESVPAAHRVAPGGASTIVLGGDASAAQPLPVGECRVAPGGVDTLVLGDATSADQFSHRAVKQGYTAVPDALQRFTCAPGGNSTIVFGASDDAAQPDQARVAPGGASTLVLGGDCVANDASVSAVRTAPGGEATIVLGEVTAADRFSHRQGETAPAETPDAVARFPCAPGGNSTFVMGADSSHDVVSSGRVAPGGESTLIIGVDASYVANTPSRGAVGGETTVFLGDLKDTDRFSHRQANEAISTAELDAAPRFPCAPGGDSTINLRNDNVAPAPLMSDRVAPGGTATIVLGGDHVHSATLPVGCSPGGPATIMLGADASADRFSHHHAQEVGAVPDPSPRFMFAPGGASSVVLGNGSEMSMTPITGKVGKVAAIPAKKLDFEAVDENVNTSNLPLATNEEQIQKASVVSDSAGLSVRSAPVTLG